MLRLRYDQRDRPDRARPVLIHDWYEPRHRFPVFTSLPDGGLSLTALLKTFPATLFRTPASCFLGGHSMPAEL